MHHLPKNYEMHMLTSTCCDIAGLFDYIAKHFEVSIQIGELLLFPTILEPEGVIIAASGTSCRHQIKDTIKHYFILISA